MKRWMISAIITFVILVIACIVSSFFTVEEVASVETKSAGESVVTVIKKIRPKKKVVQKKVVKKENVIASSDAVVQKDEKNEEEPQEDAEEIPETDDSQAEENDDSAEIPDDEGSVDGDEFADETTLSGDAKKSFENYRTYALKRITAKKMYPMKSRAKGQEGNVKLRVEIDTDGTLLKAEITRPCEFEELNEAALAAVAKSAPFKKMSPGSKKIALNIVMEFKLQ